MKRLIAACLLVACSGVLAKEKHTPDSVTAVAIGYTVYPHVTDLSFTLPGRIDSDCYSTGSAYYADVRCTSYISPPVDVPIVLTSATIVNRLIVGNQIVTVMCVAHRDASTCVRLEPEDWFRVSFEGSKAQVEVHPGKKWVTQTVLKVEPITYRSAQTRRDSWCFNKLTDIVQLAIAFKQEGKTAGFNRLDRMIDGGYAFNVAAGSDLNVGVTTENVSAVQSHDGVCYIPNVAFDGMVRVQNDGSQLLRTHRTTRHCSRICSRTPREAGTHGATG